MKQRAAKGDGEAQFSLGYRLASEVEVGAGRHLGMAGKSPNADVGFAQHTFRSLK